MQAIITLDLPMFENKTTSSLFSKFFLVLHLSFINVIASGFTKRVTERVHVKKHFTLARTHSLLLADSIVSQTVYSETASEWQSSFAGER